MASIWARRSFQSLIMSEEVEEEESPLSGEVSPRFSLRPSRTECELKVPLLIFEYLDLYLLLKLNKLSIGA